MVGIVSLEVVEEDGVIEMPIIAGQIAVGVCGTHILCVGMVPSFLVVGILELDGNIFDWHNIDGPVLCHMTPLIVVSFQKLG
jgi:hypothetical protein